MTALPPGPELDAKVAEAMGWTRKDGRLSGVMIWKHPDGGWMHSKAWCPSTDRAQACTVVLDWLVAKLAAQGLKISIMRDADGWYVDGWRSSEEPLSFAVTLEHAISLAALALSEAA